MLDRAFNFAAGPGILPLPVLEQAQRDLVSLPGVGASPLEVSHRGSWFTSVIDETVANLRDLLAIPDGYQVVFCQGGAIHPAELIPPSIIEAEGMVHQVAAPNGGISPICPSLPPRRIRVAAPGSGAVT